MIRVRLASRIFRSYGKSTPDPTAGLRSPGAPWEGRPETGPPDGCRLSLVIPAYNEEDRIEETVVQAVRYLERLDRPAELIVVDDGSRDGTAAKLSALGDRLPALRVVALSENRGKGAAVRQGIQEARGELVVFCDADLSFPLGQTGRLLKKLDEGYHIAIGCRESLNKDSSGIPAWRRLVSLGARSLPRWLGLTSVRDSQCGFKGFRRSDILPVLRAGRVDRFAFDVEWLYLARQAGLRAAEVPVAWRHRGGSTVNLAAVLESTWSLLKIKVWAAGGLYTRIGGTPVAGSTAGKDFARQLPVAWSGFRRPGAR